MKIKDMKLAAKNVIRQQWGSLLLALILSSIIVVCGNIVPVVGAILVVGPVTYGLNMVYYIASKQLKVNLWDIFKGFEENFGESFLLQILRSLFTFLWSLLFIIPGIIKHYAYSMSFYLMMREKDLTARDALRKSCAMMKGYKWKLFCLELSFLGWMILSAMTFGILHMYVKPLMNAARIEFCNYVYEVRTTPAIEEVSAQ